MAGRCPWTAAPVAIEARFGEAERPCGKRGLVEDSAASRHQTDGGGWRPRLAGTGHRRPQPVNQPPHGTRLLDLAHSALLGSDQRRHRNGRDNSSIPRIWKIVLARAGMVA